MGDLDVIQNMFNHFLDLEFSFFGTTIKVSYIVIFIMICSIVSIIFHNRGD